MEGSIITELQSGRTNGIKRQRTVESNDDRTDLILELQNEIRELRGKSKERDIEHKRFIDDMSKELSCLKDSECFIEENDSKLSLHPEPLQDFCRALLKIPKGASITLIREENGVRIAAQEQASCTIL